MPRIFTAVADMLEWCVKEQGVSHLLHYLDDYLTMGSAGLEECNVNIEWDIVMLWAAMTLYFYGFLRAGEVVVPADTELDPAQYLTYADIAVDDCFCLKMDTHLPKECFVARVREVLQQISIDQSKYSGHVLE